MMANRIGTCHLLALMAVAACSRAARVPQAELNDAGLLHDAVHQLTNVIVYDIFSPPQASRVYAYASIAVFEFGGVGEAEGVPVLVGEHRGRGIGNDAVSAGVFGKWRRLQ